MRNWMDAPLHRSFLPTSIIQYLESANRMRRRQERSHMCALGHSSFARDTRISGRTPAYLHLMNANYSTDILRPA